jgi:hypothetical protein
MVESLASSRWILEGKWTIILEMDFILVGEPHESAPDIRRGEILPD